MCGHGELKAGWGGLGNDKSEKLEGKWEDQRRLWSVKMAIPPKQ